MQYQYKYMLVIVFKSGNIWELGIHTKELGMTFARMLVQRSGDDIHKLFLVKEKTGRATDLDIRKLMN